MFGVRTSSSVVFLLVRVYHKYRVAQKIGIIFVRLNFAKY